MSAILWSAEEAVAATGGKTVGSWNATGISIDTRTVEKGDLFIALKGDARDGHDFVADALGRGAAAALVSMRPPGVAADAPLLIVADTQKGLEALGRAARARSKAKIVAVTGSAGKTTTKEMLRLMLGRAGKVAASAASYNNHWGVPLSLARMPRDADYGVFEIGMNHAGEIRALVSAVRPHAAIITTIAPAHLEYFGTLEAIADAKAEIFEGLDADGAAILPIDNPQFARLSEQARARRIGRLLSFGRGEGADARLIAAKDAGDGQAVTAIIDGETLSFRIGAGGAHIASNAMAALLAARELGASLGDMAKALAEFGALKGRGARIAAGGVEIIDESYNANPASMAAALSLLAQAKPKPGGRRIAILGDMLELGAQSGALHAGLLKDIEAAAADAVFLCGAHMRSLWQALPERLRGGHAETSQELAQAVLTYVRPGDAVLVKGSFGSRMIVIIDALRTARAATA